MGPRQNISKLAFSGLIACALSFGFVASVSAADKSVKLSAVKGLTKLSAKPTTDRLTKLMKSLGLNVDTSKDPNLTSSDFSSSGLSSTAATYGCKNCSTPSEVIPNVVREISSDDVSSAGVKDIIGDKDSRRELTPEEEKLFSGVGAIVCSNPSINKGKISTSSASLIYDTQTILVVSHSFWNPITNQRYSSRDCVFKLINAAKKIYFMSPIQISSSGSAMSSELSEYNPDDWFVARLEVPAPRGTKSYGFQKFTNGQPDFKLSVIIPAYQYNSSLMTTLKEGKFIVDSCEAWSPGPNRWDVQGVAMRHSCDTEGGASGAPVFYIDEKGAPIIVGVHIGSAENPEQRGQFNRAVRMDGDLYNAVVSATGQKIAVSK